MRHTDRRCLEHRGVRGCRRLDLRRSDPLPGHLERIVGAPLDVPEPVFIYAGPIAVHPDVGKALPVRGQILVWIAPKPSRHPGPRPADDELADGPAQGTPRCIRHVRRNPRDRARECRWLERRPGRAAEDAAGALGAAGVIDERRALFTHHVEIPPPRFRIPRLAGRAEHEHRRAIVAPHGLLTGAHQSPNRCRRNPEVRDAMTLDN